MSDAKVVQFKAPPKRVSNKYKGWDYTVVYIPATGEWQWTITKTHTTEYTETASTMKEAIKAAHKFIDTLA